MNDPLARSPNTLLITTLAMYQTEFWADVADELKTQGCTVAFISFDDRSSELLRGRGYRVFGVSGGEAKALASEPADFDADMAKYGIDNVNYWLAHERITFDISDGVSLRVRFQRYLGLASRACESMLAEGPVTMVQELGGFVSVVASFFAARNAGIDNWFIEPSFFRGRMFFLKNSFAAKRIPSTASLSGNATVAEYLQRTLDQRAIVVPQKDRHHYTSALHKIANLTNMRRLVQKLIDKHLFGKHQEFGHIGVHVVRHTQMLVNSLRMRGHYTPIDKLGTFIYYPLHVPADMALTLRSPQYLDQLAVIDYLARSIPHTHVLAIKEHPAMIGAVDASRLIALLNRYDNVALISPGTNNFEVLQACDAVVSINSKSGAEAILLSKPVLVLGDAFYRDSPLATPVNMMADLPRILTSKLAQHVVEDSKAVNRYFEQVWSCTFAGELYVREVQNISTFSVSMRAAVLQ